MLRVAWVMVTVYVSFYASWHRVAVTFFSLYQSRILFF